MLGVGHLDQTAELISARFVLGVMACRRRKRSRSPRLLYNAARTLALAPTALKDRWLHRAVETLLVRQDAILQANAADVAESAQNFLSLYRSVSQSVGTRGADRDIKKVFDSIQVNQKDNRAIVTASIPQAFLKKITSDAQAPASPGPINKPLDYMAPEAICWDSVKRRYLLGFTGISRIRTS